MKTHLDNLIAHIPGLMNGKILDLGAGNGKFIIEVKKRGGNITGIEKNQDYINNSYAKAASFGCKIEIIKGEGENIPFKDESFDFINLSEVIEHVENPEKVIHEISRILKPGGFAYMSAPNRFGLKDPHFNLYFINFLPRCAADFFISLFKRHKNYTGDRGRQRLDEMHYYTFSSLKKTILKNKFIITDIREKRIRKFFSNKFFLFTALFLYKMLRFFYFDSFHLLLKKNI